MAPRDPGRRRPVPKMTIPHADSTTAGPPTGLEVELQAYIGRQLRAVYDEIVNEPVPDKFVQLLEELQRKKTGQA
jgi:Anti-sigma factor NepR